MSSFRLGVVVPLYNEGAVLELFHTSLVRALKATAVTWRILYVNDGSVDNTETVLEGLRRDRRVEVATLWPNGGQQAAILAGLQRCWPHDAVWVLDGDLQKPPALLQAFLRQVSQTPVVFGVAESTERGWFKRWSSWAFYRIFNFACTTQLIPGGSDFFMLSARARGLLVSRWCVGGAPPSRVFVRAMIASLGLPTGRVMYAERARAAGQSKYTFRRMLALAWDGLRGFAGPVPLRLNRRSGE